MREPVIGSGMNEMVLVSRSYPNTTATGPLVNSGPVLFCISAWVAGRIAIWVPENMVRNIAEWILCNIIWNAANNISCNIFCNVVGNIARNEIACNLIVGNYIVGWRAI
jgi:hypothetical protein